MAFQFPDPNVTDEFTAPNGFTYIYDQAQALWKLAKKEPAVPMRVAPKFKSLTHLASKDNNNYKCYYIGTSDSKYQIKLQGITRFAARNPETNRIIVITDKGHTSWSDDDGATWQTNSEYYNEPLAWNYYQKSSSTVTGYHEDYGSEWTWCGGKRWMSFNANHCRIAWTDNDFENVYTCRFDTHNLANEDLKSRAPRKYRYCEETDELWWLFTDGHILKIDPDISGWMDTVKNTIGQYGFSPPLPSDMAGVLKRQQLIFRKDGYNDIYTGRTFEALALSPHGTKVAWAGGGVCIRTENDFTTYSYGTVAGWDYNFNQQVLYDDKVTPNVQYRRITDCYYVKETDVWIACGVKDFYVSFDDAKTWQGVDVRSVANAYDVAQAPYVSTNQDGSKYTYYGGTSLSNFVGYTKGMYLYQLYEKVVPEYYKHSEKGSGTSPYENYGYERVLYCSADLKNWTRTVLPTSQKTKFNSGPITFLEDREAFLSGYGFSENSKTEQLVYFDSYI